MTIMTGLTEVVNIDTDIHEGVYRLLFSNGSAVLLYRCAI